MNAKLPIFLLALLVGAGAVNAQSVNTLGYPDGTPFSGFGLLKQFHNVPNTDDLPGLFVYMSTMNPGASLFQAADGTNIDWKCSAPRPSVVSPPDPDSTKVSSVYDFSSAQCTDGIARTLAVTVHSKTEHRACSGRGCNPWKTYWFLDTGSITTQ